MYSIKSGSTQGRPDTSAFIELLNQWPAPVRSAWPDFFSPAGELIVSRAPGRLDLMGGIADYSGSLVLQLPIAQATHVALQLHDQEALGIVSLPSVKDETPRIFAMPLADLRNADQPIDYPAARAYFSRQTTQHWAAYIAGAFLVLMREKGCRFAQGARLLISSSVPEGKGVSSSASLEVAVMQAITAAYGMVMSPREMAFLCQQVENSVAGAPCGVMDQMTAACGEADHLLLLLCQPGELQGTLKLPADLAVWGIDSGIRHSVGGADYGTIRTAAFMGYRMIAEAAGLRCHAANSAGHVRIDDRRWGGYLANLTPEEFAQSYAAGLPEQVSGAEFLKQYEGISDPVTAVDPARRYPVNRATRHPIYEHARVRSFAQILKNWRDIEQAPSLGALMYQSHDSYSACGLGSPGTDELVTLVREVGIAGGLYGAKITGGGSGGTVAVLGHREAGKSVAAVVERYAQRTGFPPVVISGSSMGAGLFGHLKLERTLRQGE